MLQLYRKNFSIFQLEVEKLEQTGPELFIATASWLGEAQAQQAEGSPQGRIPDDITPKQCMTSKSEWSLICACFNLRKLHMAGYR